MNEKTLTVEYDFKQSPERVFDAWLDPAMARQFLFATPEGEMVRADIDPKVGGRFIFVDRRDGTDIEHIGEYLEIHRPRRLAFTFKVPAFSAESTTVRIDVEPSGQGSRVTLTHEGVLPDWTEKTREGWKTILANLDQVLR